MKLINMLLLGVTMINFSIFAQPSKEQVIKQIKSENSKIYKVVCSSPEKRIEGGIGKWYYGINIYFSTEYTGISRIHSTTCRYVGNTYEKTLSGTNSYTGMKNPDISFCKKIVEDNRDKFYGYYFKNIIAGSENIVLAENPDFYWGNLNGTSFLVESTYKVLKGQSTVVTEKVIKRVSLSRSVDGKSWDPHAKMLPNGIWKMTYANTKKTEVIGKKELSEGQRKEVSTIGQIEAIEKSKAFISTLPKVEIPKFNSDKHVIRYFHELMMEGDEGKIEVVLNEMLPDSYFSDRSNYFYTQYGLDRLNEILDLSKKYRTLFCMSPQIKNQKYGLVQFYTRDLRGSGYIEVYQTKSGKWVISKVREPVFQAGTNMKNLTTNLKAAGETNCGESLNIEPPAPEVQYNVGDRVFCEYENVWYKATVSKKDPQYSNRYFVNYDDGSSSWTTNKLMKPLLKEDDKKKSTTTSDSKSKKNKVTIKKPKVNIKGIKLKL